MGANVDQEDYTVIQKDPGEISPKGPSGYHENVNGIVEHFYRRKSRSDMTSLHWAAAFGHKDIVEILLERGADINKPVHILWILSPYMATCGTVDMAGQLGRWYEVYHWGVNSLYFTLGGASKEEETGKYVSSEDRVDTAKLLIRKGASLNTHETRKTHALHQSCAQPNLEMVRFLLEDMKVDANVKDRFECTALHYLPAPSQSHPDIPRIFELLLKHGANINAVNMYDVTPLSLCLSMNRYLRYKYTTRRSRIEHSDQSPGEFFEMSNAALLISEGAGFWGNIPKPEQRLSRAMKMVKEGKVLHLVSELPTDIANQLLKSYYYYYSSSVSMKRKQRLEEFWVFFPNLKIAGSRKMAADPTVRKERPPPL